MCAAQEITVGLAPASGEYSYLVSPYSYCEAGGGGGGGGFLRTQRTSSKSATAIDLLYEPNITSSYLLLKIQ